MDDVSASEPRTSAQGARSGGALKVLDRRHEHWLLASMLLVLHATIDAGLDGALSRALMTAHLGLFFLWQPIWQKDQRLQLPGILLIVALVGGVLATLSWWVIFAWLIVLIGIVAGRSFSTRRERYVYLLSLAFLVTELLVICAGQLLLGNPLPAALVAPFRVGLYLLPLALYAIPAITVPPRDPFPVDFFRGIAFALMTALLAVFSALVTFRLRVDYPLALIGSLMALALLLLLLSWLTTPGSSGSGLLAVWEKSVLNIGTPFEAWLGNIANLAAQSDDADDFLEAAAAELNDIPWISGVAWRTARTSGMSGHRSHHHLAVDSGPVRVTLFTERSFSSALLIHCRLLIQVLGHFYVAKRRENEEANEAQLRAIYETGARVTHDIKNLLQALNAMTGALDTAATPEQEQRAVALIKRRLPDLALRLRRALDKLADPRAQSSETLSVEQWWRTLQTRLPEHGPVHASATLEQAARRIPRDCFDSVVDNLLDNALHKVAAGDATRIEIELAATVHGIALSVCDDGAAVPQAIARALFEGPVESQTGHGIGLFQAARQARLAGCTLELGENRDGAVCFHLRCAPPASAS